MSQSTDAFTVANGSGATVRSGINADLLALATLSSGGSAPASPSAHMLWADTTNKQLKKRNAANSGWIILANLDETNTIVSPAFPVGECQFLYASTTQCLLKPKNGNRITFPDGSSYTVPSAGLAGANTATSLNGVGGSSLAASTTYYAYLWENSGSPIIDWSTTGHVTDSASGIEIKSGPDTTRVLVGAVRTDGSGNFQNTAAARGVASWFNRQTEQLDGGSSLTGLFGHSAAFALVGSVLQVSYFQWADETAAIAVSGGVYAGNGSDNTILTLQLALDTVTSNMAQATVTGNSNTHDVPIGLVGAIQGTEGWHTIGLYYLDNSTGGHVDGARMTGSVRM